MPRCNRYINILMFLKLCFFETTSIFNNFLFMMHIIFQYPGTHTQNMFQQKSVTHINMYGPGTDWLGGLILKKYSQVV